jgi:ABC-type polysaccharide/polyol phosphate export permease
MAPAVANLVGLAVSTALLIVLAPLLGGSVGAGVLWLVPGLVLLVLFTTALSMVLAALHVYFRDVRFLVQAALLVWFYVTPIIYPASFLGGLRTLVDLNPMTGVVTMFHAAVVGADGNWVRPVAVTVVATIALVGVAVAAYRRHDRLFVDQL